MRQWLKSEAVTDASLGSLPDWSTVGRVLLIRLRSIGDTVLMTPCLSAIKSWRPDIEVAVLSEPLAAPVLEDHPLVDDLIIAGADLLSRARLIHGLRRQRFDVAYNLHGGTTATIMARLSGARYTVGYKGYRQSWLLDARAPSPDLLMGKKVIHSVEQQLALLRWSGVPDSGAWPWLSLKTSPEAEASVRSRLNGCGFGSRAASAGFAVVGPAAALESKRWPAARFAAVADHLSEKWNLPSVVIAGEGQRPVAEQVAAAARTSPLILTGLSLKELMALIGMAVLFVGNDSGPAHIAAALDRPQVVVFGASNVTVWRPWTRSPNRVVKLQPSQHSISQISSSEVVAAVDEVMQDINKERLQASEAQPGALRPPPPFAEHIVGNDT